MLRCGDCSDDKLVAFSCKRRGLQPVVRRLAQTAAHLVHHVIPRVPVRQWVLALPIPPRLLLAAQPKLVTPVLQVVHRQITRHLLGQAGLNADGANRRGLLSGEHFSVDGTLIQAWASHKSMRRKDGSAGGRPPEDWCREPRSNDTRASTNDPESQL
jgi:hypothetical protein